MIDDAWSETEEIKSVKMKRPHLVILGAGASLASFPNGDMNGKKLPIMRTFTETVGLTNLLESEGIKLPYDDFEAIYSDIAVDPSRVKLKDEIEFRISTYFSSLELPDNPTMYDHLILCLRPKDVIATFNWDPFLCQAASRNSAFCKPPSLLFLHGNVAFSYCSDCKIIFPLQTRCQKCGKALIKPPLLYPVKQKNYQANDAIANHWKRLEFALKSAWALTVFGYGAPKTDVEAIRLMKTAWGETDQRELEQTEIIDIQKKEDLVKNWDPFIHTHHYETKESFYDSYIARFPRRSGEALWTQLMECKFLEMREFPQYKTFDQLYEYLQPRVDVESET